MAITLIYLTLFLIGIVLLFVGIIWKEKALKIISALCLGFLILLGVMFFVLLSFSNM